MSEKSKILLSFLVLCVLVACSPNKKKDMETIAIVWKGDKCGLMNSSGKSITPIQYDFLKITCSELIEAKLQGKFGYLNRAGEVKIDFSFDVTSGFYEGKAMVAIDSAYYFIDESGNKLFNIEFQEASVFSEGIAGVKIKDKWGFIDTNGTVVIPPRFDYAFYFEKNYCVVTNDTMMGVIDKKGNLVVPVEYDVITYTDVANQFIAVKNNKSSILEVEGEACTNVLNREVAQAGPLLEYDPVEVDPLDCDRQPSFSLTYIRDSNSMLSVWNSSTRKEYCCFHRIFMVNPATVIGQNVQYTEENNSSTMMLIQASGISAFDLKEFEFIRASNSLLIVQKDGKVGAVDLSLNAIIPFEYQDILAIKNDFMLIQKDDQYFLSTAQGQILSDSLGSDISECIFYSDAIVFKKDEKYGWMNYEGKVIAQPEYDKAVKFER